MKNKGRKRFLKARMKFKRFDTSNYSTCNESPEASTFYPIRVHTYTQTQIATIEESDKRKESKKPACRYHFPTIYPTHFTQFIPHILLANENFFFRKFSDEIYTLKPTIGCIESSIFFLFFFWHNLQRKIPSF